jgi:hypothetical protein
MLSRWKYAMGKELVGDGCIRDRATLQMTEGRRRGNGSREARHVSPDERQRLPQKKTAANRREKAKETKLFSGRTQTTLPLPFPPLR